MSCAAETVFDYNLMIHIITLLLNQQCWYKNNITFRIWSVLLSPATCPKPWNWRYLDEKKINETHIWFIPYQQVLSISRYFQSVYIWNYLFDGFPPPHWIRHQVQLWCKGHMSTFWDKSGKRLLIVGCWGIFLVLHSDVRSTSIGRYPQDMSALLKSTTWHVTFVLINCIRARRNNIGLNCKANPTHTKVK